MSTRDPDERLDDSLDGPVNDPLDDDRDQTQPCEFTEDMDWSKWDFDNDPDWR